MLFKKESIVKGLSRIFKFDYTIKDNYQNIDVVGKCPKCSKDIVEVDGYYSCVGILSGNCDYKQRSSFEGERLTYEEIIKFEKYKKMMDSNFLDEKIEPVNHVNKVVVNTKNKKAKSKKGVQEPSLGSCPKCNHSIIEEYNEYSCVNCDYHLSKYFSNSIIQPSQIKLLLDNKTTALINLKKKDGTPFTTRLKLDSEKYNYTFASYEKKNVTTLSNSDEGKKKEKTVYQNKKHNSKNTSENKCPMCGKEVVMGKQSYGCKGNLDGTCKFTVPFEFECMPISEDDMKVLLRGSTLTVYRFDNPNDEIDLKLNENGVLEEVPF